MKTNTTLAGPWEPHVGLDYACVMRPGENTEIASIEIKADCPQTRDELVLVIAALPDLVSALDAAREIPWVANAAITDDIEALRKIALAYSAWNNGVLLPALAKAGVRA